MEKKAPQVRREKCGAEERMRSQMKYGRKWLAFHSYTYFVSTELAEYLYKGRVSLLLSRYIRSEYYPELCFTDWVYE